MNKSFFFLINRFQNHIILTNSIDYIYDSKRFSLLVRFNITTVYRESERNNVKFWILSTIQYATIKRQWATTIAKRSTLFPFGKYFSFLLLFLSFLLPPFSRNEITVSIFNRFLFIIHFDRKTLSLSFSRDPLFTMTLPNAERKRLVRANACTYTDVPRRIQWNRTIQ